MATTEGFFVRLGYCEQWPRGRPFPVLYSRARTFSHKRLEVGTLLYVYRCDVFPHKWAFDFNRQTYGAGEIPYPELVRLTPLEVLGLGNHPATTDRAR